MVCCIVWSTYICTLLDSESAADVYQGQWQGNDHTREFVPLLCYHPNIPSVNLGQRATFADLGQTLAELLKVDAMAYGESFLSALNFTE